MNASAADVEARNRLSTSPVNRTIRIDGLAFMRSPLRLLVEARQRLAQNNSLSAQLVPAAHAPRATTGVITAATPTPSACLATEPILFELLIVAALRRATGAAATLCSAECAGVGGGRIRIRTVGGWL